MSQWQNKIVGYGMVDPETLLANEENWRTHPIYQQDVVEENLDGIGWIQDIIVNKRAGEEWPDGQRNVETVLDGHLRVMLALRNVQKEVPIKYVDLTPEEERAALLFLDSSASMAGANVDKLAELIDLVEPLGNSTAELMNLLAEQYDVNADKEEDEEADEREDEEDEEDENFTRFVFGDYKGLVHVDVYEAFVGFAERLKQDTGKVTVVEILEALLADKL